jgi:hypothetical protein
MDEFTRYLTDVSTKVDTYQQPREPVEGGGGVGTRAVAVAPALASAGAGRSPAEEHT